MIESSFPPSRAGAAAIPDSIFITRQMMILLRCLTLTPPFLNHLSPEMLHRPGGFPWWAPGPAALPVSEGCSAGSRSCPRVLYFPWPARRPAVQHPTDHTIVHTGGPHPSVRRDVRGIEEALWSLSQGAVPASVMFTPSSTQEECHGLGRPPSPLWGGSL